MEPPCLEGRKFPFPPRPQALPAILWDRDGQVFNTLLKIKESFPQGKDFCCRAPPALLKSSEISEICPPLCSPALPRGNPPPFRVPSWLCHQEFCFSKQQVPVWVGFEQRQRIRAQGREFPRGVLSSLKPDTGSQVQTRLS